MARQSGICKKENAVKNVLFLAPGPEYAKTVITNLLDALKRKEIDYSTTAGRETAVVRTDRVLLQITHIDPIRWATHMFESVDAVFGKKELVEKAREFCFHMFIDTPKMSLSKYIIEAHSIETDDTKPRTTYIPEITKVHFNDPMTIVLWDDGTKTMVKCQEGDTFSKETGLALCIAKKSLGNMPNFNNIFKKWIPEEPTYTYASQGNDTVFTLSGFKEDLTQRFLDDVSKKIEEILTKSRRRGVEEV